MTRGTEIKLTLLMSAIAKACLLGYIVIPLLVFAGSQAMGLIGLQSDIDGRLIAGMGLGAVLGYHFRSWIWDIEGVQNYVKEKYKNEKG